MQCTSSVVWSCLGYALKGEQVVGKLERTIGKPYALKIWRLPPLCLMWCIVFGENGAQ